MYSSVPKALGEIVVNGYDADATLVLVTSTATTITIEDNGSGMDEIAIRDKYAVLASGHKRHEARTPDLRRLPIGAKGIGKLAGLGIARRVEIETWRDGLAFAYAIDRDEMDNGERAGAGGEAMLDRAFMTLVSKPSRDTGSGTRVTLRKLRPEARFEAKKVREHLAQELPLGDLFRVIVDAKEVRKDEVKGRRIAIRHVDPVCGLIEGHIVIAGRALHQPGVITTVRGRAVGGPGFFDVILSNRRYHSTDVIAGQIEVSGLDPDDGTPSAIKTDREGFLTNHPRYVAYATFMTDEINRIAKGIEDDAERRRDDDRRAKLTEAVAHVTEVFNAYNEHMRRLLQATTAKASLRGTLDEANGQLLPHAVVEAEDQGGTRPRTTEESPPPRADEAIPVVLGSGRLRFRNQTFQVVIAPRGEAAPECEIQRDHGRVIVNEQHPSYEEAVRNRWTEAVVLRAVATKFVCEESPTAAEAYEMLDEILRFAAKRSKRRRAGQIEVDEHEELARAG
jgi:hypothetical protein